MSEETNSGKRQPSHDGFAVRERDGAPDQWHEAGAFWPTKEGGYSGEIDNGVVRFKFVLRPRESLDALREKKAQQANAAPDQGPKQSP